MATTLTGCGSADQLGSPETSVPVPAPRPTAPRPTVPRSTDAPPVDSPKLASREWIGGEPAWEETNAAVEEAAASAEFSEGDDAITAAAGAGDADLAAPRSDAKRSTGATTSAERFEASGYLDEEFVESPVENVAPLRAGSVDDNATFTDYLAYRKRIEALGVAVRSVPVDDRIVIRLRRGDAKPAARRQIAIRSGGVGGEVLARLTSSADGSARFHPSAYGVSSQAKLFAEVDGTSAPLTAGVDLDLLLPDARAVEQSMPIDVLFLLDATGSMGDEIDRLKTTIDGVAQRLSSLPGTSDVRIAMTLYRDTEDAFVTATYDFTNDIGKFRRALASVRADGGGDYPEALDEALADALAKPSWRPSGEAIQLVFLVADAPPQIGRQVATPYSASMKEAAARGIKVFPIASSETDDQAEYVFRQLAQFTGARFVFLSYGAQGALGGTATGSASNVGQSDYAELSLDDLVVRLVGEEAAARLGTKLGQTPQKPQGSSVQ